MLSWILVLLAIGSSFAGLTLVFTLRHHAKQWSIEQINTKNYPILTVIAPNRGKINQRNIKALLKQDYPGTWEIIFVTTNDDISLEQLKIYEKEYEHIKIITTENVVELAQRNGIHICQKNHNLVAGIKNASPETEIYVFIDADTCPLSNWLRNIVAPFEKNFHIGAVTSARIYIPGKGLASWIQFAWILFSSLFMVGPCRYIWGGGLAIPKVVFEKADLIQHINGNAGISITTDDLNLLIALKRHGYDTFFSPDCLVPRYPPETKETLLNVIKFTNRQVLHIWWVSKKIWLVFFLTYGIRTPAIISAFILVYWNPVGLLAIISIAIDFMCGFLLKNICFATDDMKIRLKFWVILLPILTPCLASINFISAPFHRKMRWSGIEYTKRTVLGYTNDFSWRSKHTM